MVLIKIFAAIILTKLQRFERRANVKKTYNAEGPDCRMGEEKFADLGKFYAIQK